MRILNPKGLLARDYGITSLFQGDKVHLLVLGATELRDEEGRSVHIGGLRRRAVLAASALEFDHVIPVPRLLRIVWDDAPAQARTALQGHIAALRRLLPSGLGYETRPEGYRLYGDPRAVDCAVFVDAVSRARTLDDDEAAHLLRQALGLWRGTAFADLESLTFFQSSSIKLHDVRIEALEEWTKRLLRLGRAKQAVPTLQIALQADGHRQSLAGLLMLCLKQADRTAEALEIYHATSTRLITESDTRPGPFLRDALGQVLSQSATGEGRPAPCPPKPTHIPSPNVAAQVAGEVSQLTDGTRLSGSGAGTDLLPQALPHFVPRDRSMQWLDELSEPGELRTHLAVLTGPAGVGKTELAVRWAHDAAVRYPGGVLCADLGGLGPSPPPDAARILARFLVALGVSAAALPEGVPARSALFQEAVRSSEVLVVLDNVRSASQIEPLLSDTTTSTILVVSRAAFADLVSEHGAAWHCLAPLDHAECLALLEVSIGRERVAAEEEQARQLCALCDGLPLAVRIAGARLAARPGWRIGDLLEEFQDEYVRLQTLDGAVARGVSAALRLARQQLGHNAQTALALIALHPGTDIDAHIIAALLDTGSGTARRILGELAAWSLLSEVRPGRFQRSSMVGAYSHALLLDGFASERICAAASRLAEYYVSALAAAFQLTDDSAPPNGGFRSVGCTQAPSSGPRAAEDARGWLEREVAVARDLGSIVADLGLPEVETKLRAAVVRAQRSGF
jgi:DNA-binding SARP family transcriptional activator